VQSQVFLGRDLNNEQNYSDAIAYDIDLEIQRIIKECYDRAKQILTENREKLNLIAETLLEIETLDAEQINSLFNKGVLPDRSTASNDVSPSEDVKVNINKNEDPKE
ncbi:MAG TPA: cell division protein FtsH, partial [Niallia sp.]|nr:cell division protein FtsH [Niallia sp.]